MKEKNCPHCEELVPQTEFCIKCGKKLEIDLFEASLKKTFRICHHCEKNLPDTNWCIYCGKKQETRTIPKHIQEVEIVTCPLCRQEVPTSHNFCHLCGGKLKKKTIGSNAVNFFCSRCLKPNPPDTEYCIHCGLKQQMKQSKLLEEPFQGFQLDLSYFFQPVTFPLSTLRQGLTSSKNFPVKSIISQSKYFGVIKSRKASLLYRNIGGFDRNNMLHYLGSFGLMLIIYTFWYYIRYADLVDRIDPLTDGMLILLFGGVFLTSLLMIPIWLSTFLLYRTNGYRMNYRLDFSRVFMTVIFNTIWLLFVGFGPILLQVGDFKDSKDHIIMHKSFIRGIAWGAVITVSLTMILALLSFAIVGVPGVFAGFIFQNHPIKSHLLTSYIGATWLVLILLLPFGDYFDKVIKRWNQFGYLILLAIGFLFLIHSFNLMDLLTQRIIRA